MWWLLGLAVCGEGFVLHPGQPAGCWRPAVAPPTDGYSRVEGQLTPLRFDDVVASYEAGDAWSTYETLLVLRRLYAGETTDISVIVERAAATLQVLGSRRAAELCAIVGRLPSGPAEAAFFRAAKDAVEWKELEPMHLAMGLRAFAKGGYFDPVVFQNAVTATKDKVSSFNAKDCSHVAWALTRYGDRRGPMASFIGALDGIALRISALATTNEVPSVGELSNVAWAVAKAAPRKNQWRPAYDRCFSDVVLRAVLKRATADERAGVVNLAWALARYAKDHRPVLPSDVVEGIADLYRPPENGCRNPGRELSTMAWALATLRHGIRRPKRDALFTRLRDAALRGNALDHFNAWELSQFAWAFAKGAPSKTHRLFPVLATVFVDKLNDHRRRKQNARDDDEEDDDFSMQALSNVVWAFAKVRARPLQSELFGTVATEVERRLVLAQEDDDYSTTTPQDLSNTVYAYASANVSAPALFEAVAAMAPNMMARNVVFKPQELTNLAWAFATAYAKQGFHPACHHYTSPTALLLDAVAREGTRLADKFKPQEISNIAWAFAKLEKSRLARRTAFASALARSATAKIHDFEAQHLSVVAFSYAKAGIADEALFNAIANAARSKKDQFNDISKTQLRQAALFVRHRAPHCASPNAIDLPPPEESASSSASPTTRRLRGPAPPPPTQSLVNQLRRNTTSHRRPATGRDDIA